MSNYAGGTNARIPIGKKGFEYVKRNKTLAASYHKTQGGSAMISLRVPVILTGCFHAGNQL
jgi:hypothetical protein